MNRLNSESSNKVVGKTVIVGVTGGIAAYKAAGLVSSLVKKDLMSMLFSLKLLLILLLLLL